MKTKRKTADELIGSLFLILFSPFFSFSCQLEAIMKTLNEAAGRLRAQVSNELSAVTEERQKLFVAASKCDPLTNNQHHYHRSRPSSS